MDARRICLVGGTGFVGQHLATELSRRGCSLKILTRRRERHRELLVFPRIELVQTDVHFVSDLTATLGECDAVVNLLGILNPAGNETFANVHSEFPAKLAEACEYHRIKHLVHLSALGVSEGAPSEYLRTKWAGEQILLDKAHNRANTTILRPSVIFGPGDSFFTRFARLIRTVPLIFPLASPNTRFQPVFVGDVVQAVCKVLDTRSSWGKTYDLAGPHVYTLRELVEYTAETIGVRKRVYPLSAKLAELQARILEKAPGKPFSQDNLRSLGVDSVTAHNGLPDLGIPPTSIDAVVPGYLGSARQTERFQAFRKFAGR